MPVTELAFFEIEPSSSPDDPRLHAYFRDVQIMLSKGSGYQFQLRRGIENTNLLVGIGGWPSVEFHQKYMTESEDAQKIVEGGKGLVTVESLVHVDVDYDEIERDAPVLAINQQKITPGKGEEFGKKFEEMKPLLAKELARYGKLTGGWQMEAEKGKDIYIAFTPWNSKDSHFVWAQDPENEGFMGAVALIDDSMMIHVTPFELK